MDYYRDYILQYVFAGRMFPSKWAGLADEWIELLTPAFLEQWTSPTGHSRRESPNNGKRLTNYSATYLCRRRSG